MPKHDAEMEAIAGCVRLLERLDGDARTRVMEYLSQRYFEPSGDSTLDKLLGAVADSTETDEPGRYKIHLVKSRHTKKPDPGPLGAA